MAVKTKKVAERQHPVRYFYLYFLLFFIRGVFNRLIFTVSTNPFPPEHGTHFPPNMGLHFPPNMGLKKKKSPPICFLGGKLTIFATVLIRYIMDEPVRKKLPSVERDSISKEKVAKLSTDLFLYGKTRWRMSVRPFRLLCMVAQTLSSEKEPPTQLSLFKTEYTYSLPKVFEYLGLEGTNQRYELLISDMKELMGTVIEYKTFSKRGAIRWKAINLLSYCDMDEETGRIVVQLNDKAKGYLVGMKRWCALQPKYYLKLSTEYQNWFYAFLRKEAGVQPSITVDIDILKEMLCIDSLKYYDPEQNKNANEKFFSKVLGIEKPKEWKYKQQGKNEPWDYTSDKDGEIFGTLGVITKETDINVSAYPIKEGRSYTKVRFDISRKKSTLSKVEKEKLHEKLNQFNLDDMGKPERKGRSKVKKPQTIADLFGSTPLVDEHRNPMASQETIPVANKVVIAAKSVRETANQLGIKPEQLAKKLGYTLRPDGDWEK